MAQCKCGATNRWRVTETRARKNAKSHIICLTCEFEWWSDIKWIPWITEEERKRLRFPFGE